MTKQEQEAYKECMSEKEKEQYRYDFEYDLTVRLNNIKGLDELIEYLCKEYAVAEYNYNQKIETDPGRHERNGIQVDVLREKITNLTMYKNGWCYAHEGGGWYVFEQ